MRYLSLLMGRLWLHWSTLRHRSPAWVLPSVNRWHWWSTSRLAVGARGFWRLSHPILGYVEVNLQIPGIRHYNEDVLLLVILTTTYSKKVPVIVGSKIIDRAMEMIMKRELARATVTWKQAHFSAVMSGSLQLPHKGKGGQGCWKGGYFLCSPQPYCTQGILSRWCPGTYLHHMEGHHPSVWDH